MEHSFALADCGAIVFVGLAAFAALGAFSGAAAGAIGLAAAGAAAAGAAGAPGAAGASVCANDTLLPSSDAMQSMTMFVASFFMTISFLWELMRPGLSQPMAVACHIAHKPEFAELR